MSSGSVSLWLEDRMNQLDALRLRRRGRLPETIEKPYWHNDAFARDSARLEALGYSVASEVDNDAYVNATYPANTGGGFGQLSRTISRRVPSIHVTYSREAPTR
jgi:hypothetical protein